MYPLSFPAPVFSSPSHPSIRSFPSWSVPPSTTFPFRAFFASHAPHEEGRRAVHDVGARNRVSCSQPVSNSAPWTLTVPGPPPPSGEDTKEPKGEMDRADPKLWRGGGMWRRLDPLHVVVDRYVLDACKQTVEADANGRPAFPRPSGWVVQNNPCTVNRATIPVDAKDGVELLHHQGGTFYALKRRTTTHFLLGFHRTLERGRTTTILHGLEGGQNAGSTVPGPTSIALCWLHGRSASFLRTSCLRSAFSPGPFNAPIAACAPVLCATGVTLHPGRSALEGPQGQLCTRLVDRSHPSRSRSLSPRVPTDRLPRMAPSNAFPSL